MKITVQSDFPLADKYIRSELPEVIDALGYPCENYFNGKVKQEFMLVDFEPVTENE